MIHTRVVLSPLENKPMPIYAESIGLNGAQEKMIRPNGYPYYHWLQTISGEGNMLLEGRTLKIPRNSGILLSPHITHTYEGNKNPWKTAYITFGGRMAHDLLHQIELKTDAIYQWETENLINKHIINLLHHIKQTDDTFSLLSSTYVYHFLLLIKNYAGLRENPEVSDKLKILQPLINWMKKNISNPDIGLRDFSNYLGISVRQLSKLFQHVFHISPYAYFINLRIRYAKQMLFDSSEITIKEVAEKVGFRSTSHFVATFKRIVGFPPDYYRKLH